MTTSQKQEIVQLAQNRKYSTAKKLCKKLCKASPSDPEAWFLLGSINGALDDYPAAEFCCRKALKFTLNNPMLIYNLGIALAKQGKSDDAIKQFETAIQLHPKYAEANFELANIYKYKGEANKAIQYYQKTLSLNPSLLHAIYNLAETYRSCGDLKQAINSYEQVIAIDNQYVDAYCGLASALIGSFKFDRTIELLKSSIKRLPETNCLYFYLALAYQEQGDTENAYKFFTKTLSIDKNHIDAKIGLAGILAVQGDYEKAGRELEDILHMHPDNSSAIICYCMYAHQFGASNIAIEIGSKHLHNSHLTNTTRSKLLFALANLHEKQCDLDTAFELYHQGNQLRNAPYDEAGYRGMFNALIKSFNQELFFQHRENNKPDNNNTVTPIFIVGMPRSGTSLAEQILASHPDVYGAGELPDIGNMVNRLASKVGTSIRYPESISDITKSELNQLANSYIELLANKVGNEKFVTDKMPLNAIHLGFISLLFPNARIIHCTRDPRDTCLSCYFKNFSGEHAYAYSLDSLGKFYRMYEQLMEHWNRVLPNPIFELSYEEIVENTEKSIREMINFCDLEWNDACLNFHKTKRTVATASHDQVRKRMYSSSVGRWKSYEKHLDELIAALKSKDSPLIDG